MDVERIVDALAHALRRDIFEERRDDGGLLAGRHHGGGHGAGGLELVSRLDHAGQRLLDALHEADRQIELLPDAGIGRAGAEHRLGGGGARRRQRDGPARGKAAHQHAPALPSPLGAADDPVDGNEDVTAACRAVGERSSGRKMAPADLDAWMVGRHERQGDAHVLAAPKKVLRIEQAEGKPKQRGLGRKRDVALVPGEPEPKRLLALVEPARDDADVAHGGGVGAREGTGQRKAGDLLAAREPR